MKRNEQKIENTWRTEDIFKDEAAFLACLDTCKELGNELCACDGKLDDASNLLSFLKGYEKLTCLLDDCLGYSSLLSDQDTADAHHQELKGKANALAVEVFTKLSFSDVQIMQIENLESFYASEPILERYRVYLEEVCRLKEHVLSQTEEKLMASSSLMQDTPYSIFGMLNNADLKFEDAIDSKGNKHTLTTGTFIHMLEQEDEVLRESAYRNFYAGYGSMIHTLAACLNGQTNQLKFNSTARKYASSLECAVDANNVSPKVYEQLIETVHKNIHVLHKYMRVRKEVMKKDKLHMYDLYVPMVNECNVPVSFEQAKEDILHSVQLYGTEYANVYERGLNSRWIDVYENEGKRSGAYSSGQRVHPFVLMNFANSLDTEFTLAHEMGHAMHSYMSTKYQAPLDRHYKIFVAEVASTCNEALLMDYLRKQNSDPKFQAYLINHFMEQFRTTLFRQCMFAEFERIINEKTANNEVLTSDTLNQIYADLNKFYYGEDVIVDDEISMEWARIPIINEKTANNEVLTSDTLNQIYADLNKFYYGEDVIVDDEISMEWARIPHFYMNFYVYQYATGFSAAMALSQKLLHGTQADIEAYLSFLKGGCTKSPVELLRMAGVDMASPKPIEDAIELFDSLIDEFESIMK